MPTYGIHIHQKRQIKRRRIVPTSALKTRPSPTFALSPVPGLPGTKRKRLFRSPRKRLAGLEKGRCRKRLASTKAGLENGWPRKRLASKKVRCLPDIAGSAIIPSFLPPSFPALTKKIEKKTKRKHSTCRDMPHETQSPPAGRVGERGRGCRPFCPSSAKTRRTNGLLCASKPPAAGHLE